MVNTVTQSTAGMVGNIVDFRFRYITQWLPVPVGNLLFYRYRTVTVHSWLLVKQYRYLVGYRYGTWLTVENCACLASYWQRCGTQIATVPSWLLTRFLPIRYRLSRLSIWYLVGQATVTSSTFLLVGHLVGYGSVPNWLLLGRLVSTSLPSQVFGIFGSFYRQWHFYQPFVFQFLIGQNLCFQAAKTMKYGSGVEGEIFNYDTVASIFHWSRAHMQIFRIAINLLFEWLFCGVSSFHRGGPGSIPGWEMSFFLPLVQDGDDLPTFYF